MRRFARLSSILELDNILSQQELREAFSDEELSDAKDRQDKVGGFLTVRGINLKHSRIGNK